MKDVAEKEVFKSRIVASNIFSKEEKERIEENYLLFKKCYCLGILDQDSSNYN